MPNKFQNVARKLINLEIRLATLVEAIKSHPDFAVIEADAEEDFETFVDEVRSVIGARRSESDGDVGPAMSFILDIEPQFNEATTSAARTDEGE